MAGFFRNVGYNGSIIGVKEAAQQSWKSLVMGAAVCLVLGSSTGSVLLAELILWTEYMQEVHDLKTALSSMALGFGVTSIFTVAGLSYFASLASQVAMLLPLIINEMYAEQLTKDQMHEHNA